MILYSPKRLILLCHRTIAGLMTTCWLAVVCEAQTSAATATTANPPRVFCADPQTLVTVKASLAANNSPYQPALRRLLAEADRDLNTKPPSVMDKTALPPSGDKHDYLSQAPYFWKDTNSPDGAYVRHDGRRNPEANADSDAGRLVKVCSNAHTLALAFYFTGDEKYAAKAAALIRVFFLNPATRMNPNLNFGQGIPGQVTGRPEGLISARSLVDLADGMGLLAGSKSWTSDDQQGMATWVGQYFDWLTTSKIGRGESAASNNHGTFCDVQAVALALFIGKTDAAKQIVTTAQMKRIASQVQPDGRLPRELARTLSFNYSVFDLQAFVDLASLGDKAGVDLWHFQTEDGRSLLKALEFMAPYADPAKKWPYQQIKSPDRGELGGVLLRAVPEYPASETLHNALKFLKARDSDDDLARLYFKMAPVETPAAN